MCKFGARRATSIVQLYKRSPAPDYSHFEILQVEGGVGEGGRETPMIAPCRVGYISHSARQKLLNEHSTDFKAACP